LITLYTAEEIEKTHIACRIVSGVLGQIKKLIKPDITTLDINNEIGRLICSAGGIPAFLNYKGFPKESCISINEEVIHGIPGSRRLKEGDIVSVDIGVFKDGFFGDMSITYPVGTIDSEKQNLINATRNALDAGIKAVVIGNRIGDISGAIEDTVVMAGFSPVRDFVGHGVGKNLHEEPQIPNFRSRDGGCKIQDGMVLAIEPMVNVGTHEVKKLGDNWTVVTKDGKPSAHFEHTVAIVNGKAEILTEVL
jgi:methionyl aminopeptidase